MKKGIVMEIRGKKAFILTTDGAFEKVRLRQDSVSVGDEMSIPVQQSVFEQWKSRPALVGGFSLALAVMLIFILPFYSQQMAVAGYVSIDINPSLEVAVNREAQVIKVKTFDDETIALLEGIDYKEMPLEVFIDTVIKVASSEGYLDKNQDILITSTSTDRDQGTEDEINNQITRVTEEIETEYKTVDVTAIQTDSESRKLASVKGVSTGKYVVYEKAKEKGEEVSIDEVKSMSVTDLYKKTGVTKEQVEKAKGLEKKIKEKNKGKGKDTAPGQNKDSGKEDKNPGKGLNKEDQNKGRNKNKDKDKDEENGKGKGKDIEEEDEDRPVNGKGSNGGNKDERGKSSENKSGENRDKETKGNPDKGRDKKNIEDRDNGNDDNSSEEEQDRTKNSDQDRGKNNNQNKYNDDESKDNEDENGEHTSWKKDEDHPSSNSKNKSNKDPSEKEDKEE